MLTRTHTSRRNTMHTLPACIILLACLCAHVATRTQAAATYIVHVGLDSSTPDSNFFLDGGVRTPLHGADVTPRGGWTFAHMYPSMLDVEVGDTVTFTFESSRRMGVAYNYTGSAALTGRAATAPFARTYAASVRSDPSTHFATTPFSMLSSGVMSRAEREAANSGSNMWSVLMSLTGTFTFVELSWGASLASCVIRVSASPVGATPADIEMYAQGNMTAHRAASVAMETTLGYSAGGVQGSAGTAHTAPAPLKINANDGVRTWQVKVGDMTSLAGIKGVYQRFVPAHLTVHMGDVVQFTSAFAGASTAWANAWPNQHFIAINGSTVGTTLDWPADGTVYEAGNPSASFADPETNAATGSVNTLYSTTFAPARSGISWYLGHNLMASGQMSATATGATNAVTGAAPNRAFSVQFALPGTYPIWSVTHGGEVQMSGTITVTTSCAPRVLPASSGLIREYPMHSGINNNLRWCVLGMANMKSARLASRSYYGDGAYSPTSTAMRTLSLTGVPLPMNRNISNTMLSKTHRLNHRPVSDFHTNVAMLLTFDIAALGSSGGASFPQPVPACDAHLDPCPTSGVSTGATIGFSRMVPLAGTGTDQTTNPTNYPNQLTSFLDASMIYGLVNTEQLPPAGGIRVEDDVQSGSSIRTFVGGQLCLTCKYSPSIPVGPGNTGTWMPAGDSRVNKAPSVYALTMVLRREHNRLAAEFAAANPSWSDEQLYQEARRFTVAFWQKMITREYLATEVGQPLPAYAGYDPLTDPSALLEFSAGAGRYGHAMLTPSLWRRDSRAEQTSEGDVQWGCALFRTDSVTAATSSGIEPLLWGMIAQRQGAVGPRMVDAVRNMPLFGAKRGLQPQGDLSVSNIQRGRDIGLPTYNQMRSILGLTPRASFAEITPDAETAADLANLYAHVDDVDLFIGGISEAPRFGGNLGETFGAIALEQTRRWRDGDRFWYENPDYFTANETAAVYATTWSMLLARNTDMSPNGTNAALLPRNAFYTLGSDLGYIARQSQPLALSTDSLYTTSMRLHPLFVLSFGVDTTTGAHMHFELRVANSGWAGIGLEPQSAGTMKGADIVICRFLTGTLAETVVGGGRTGSTGLRFECIDSYARDVGIPTPDVWLGGSDDLTQTDAFVETDFAHSAAGTRVQVFRFRRPLTPPTADAAAGYDKPLVPGSAANNVIFAFHPDSQAAVYHGPTRQRASVQFFPATLVQPPVAITYSKDSAPLQLGLLIIFAILLVLPIGVLVLVAMNSDHPRIRAATLLFCVLIPVGVAMAYIGVITAMLPKSTGTCMAFYWLTGTGFVLVFGSMTVKTFRIMRIFAVQGLGEKNKGRIVSVKITTATLAQYTLLMALAMWAILAAWTAADPLEPQYIFADGSSTHMHESCSNNSDGFLIAWLALPVALLLAGSYMSYAVRGVENTMFNESASLGQSIYVTTILSATALVFAFSLRGFANTVPLLQAVGVGAAFTFALVAQFAGKFSDIRDGNNASKIHAYTQNNANFNKSHIGGGAHASHLPAENENRILQDHHNDKVSGDKISTDLAVPGQNTTGGSFIVAKSSFGGGMEGSTTAHGGKSLRSPLQPHSQRPSMSTASLQQPHHHAGGSIGSPSAVIVHTLPKAQSSHETSPNVRPQPRLAELQVADVPGVLAAPAEPAAPAEGAWASPRE